MASVFWLSTAQRVDTWKVHVCLFHCLYKSKHVWSVQIGFTHLLSDERCLGRQMEHAEQWWPLRDGVWVTHASVMIHFISTCSVYACALHLGKCKDLFYVYRSLECYRFCALVVMFMDLYACKYTCMMLLFKVCRCESCPPLRGQEGPYRGHWACSVHPNWAAQYAVHPQEEKLLLQKTHCWCP